jgi:hypothetical protein
MRKSVLSFAVRVPTPCASAAVSTSARPPTTTALRETSHYVASRTMSRAFSSGLVFSANSFSP